MAGKGSNRFGLEVEVRRVVEDWISDTEGPVSAESHVVIVGPVVKRINLVRDGWAVEILK